MLGTLAEAIGGAARGVEDCVAEPTLALGGGGGRLARVDEGGGGGTDARTGAGAACGDVALEFVCAGGGLATSVGDRGVCCGRSGTGGVTAAFAGGGGGITLGAGGGLGGPAATSSTGSSSSSAPLSSSSSSITSTRVGDVGATPFERGSSDCPDMSSQPRYRGARAGHRRNCCLHRRLPGESARVMERSSCAPTRGRRRRRGETQADDRFRRPTARPGRPSVARWGLPNFRGRN